MGGSVDERVDRGVGERESVCVTATRRDRLRRTRLIHRWMDLFVMNQYIPVPLLGKLFGYFLVACASFSASGMGRPG